MRDIVAILGLLMVGVGLWAFDWRVSLVVVGGLMMVPPVFSQAVRAIRHAS